MTAIGHTRPGARPRGRSGVAVLLVTAVSVSACGNDPVPAPSGSSTSAPGEVPSARSPRDAAQAFADAAATSDPAAVPFAGPGGQATMTLLLKGMGDRHPTVRVERADEPGDQATAASATLRYEWPAVDDAGNRWSYDAPLNLTKSGDGWRIAMDPQAVAPGLAAGERLVAVSRPGPRGRILGAGGVVLVTERPVRRIGIDKARMAASGTATPAAFATAARKLAAAVGVDPKGYAAQVVGAGPGAFVEAIVLRDNDPALPRALAALGTIPGSTAVSETMPLAPTRSFARPLLGTVGPATAEIVEQSKGAVKAGDVVGLGGLQRSRQAQLAGRPGYRVNALAASGATRVLYDGRGAPGQDVRTTLSVKHQVLAERLLARITGPASAIVAIRPSTGAVLAAASGPGGQGNSTATLGLYPPGSTFKVVGALGMLRAGLTPAFKVPCTATITVDGRAFKNYDAYPASRLGSIPLTTAFANSCNTAMISQRDVVGRPRLVEAAASLGLTADPSLGVPAVLGRVPDETSLVAQAAAMIGQGTVQASPLGMATVAASVAAGHTVRPRLVTSPAPETTADPASPDPATPDGTPRRDHSGAPSGDQASGPTGDSGTQPPAPQGPPLTQAEATTLRGLMRAVVTSGSGSLLAGLPGVVMAKTGTAEYGDANPPLTHAWIVGIKGDLAVAVFVETGAGGAKTAGPLLKAFLAGS